MANLNDYRVYKKDGPLYGGDLHALMALSGMPAAHFRFFLGRQPTDAAFQQNNKKRPIESVLLSAFVRYLTHNLQVLEDPPLLVHKTPVDIWRRFNTLIESGDTIYSEAIHPAQFAALFGNRRTWGFSQETLMENPGAELRGSSETVKRVCDVLYKQSFRNGVDTLNTWCAIMQTEAQLRGQPEALNKGWASKANKEWVVEQMKRDEEMAKRAAAANKGKAGKEPTPA